MTLALIEMCPGYVQNCFSYAPNACVCKLIFVHASEHVQECICAHAEQYWNFICMCMPIVLSASYILYTSDLCTCKAVGKVYSSFHVQV